MSDDRILHPSSDPNQPFIQFVGGSPFSIHQSGRAPKADLPPTRRSPNSGPIPQYDPETAYDFNSIDLVVSGSDSTIAEWHEGEIQIEVRSGSLQVTFAGVTDDTPGSAQVYWSHRVYAPVNPDDPSEDDFTWVEEERREFAGSVTLNAGDRLLIASYVHSIRNVSADGVCEIEVNRHGLGLQEVICIHGPCSPCFRYPP